MPTHDLFPPVSLPLGYEEGNLKYLDITNGAAVVRYTTNQENNSPVEPISANDCNQLYESSMQECAGCSNSTNFSNFTRRTYEPISNEPNFNKQQFDLLCSQACLTREYPNKESFLRQVCGI